MSSYWQYNEVFGKLHLVRGIKIPGKVHRIDNFVMELTGYLPA